jgi:tetratricopeptide (TPR) repeat protein
MKKTITIIIGIISLGFFIVIVKNNFFDQSNNSDIEKAFDAYDKKNYNEAILYFQKVDIQENKIITSYLGDAHLQVGEYVPANKYLLKAYQQKTDEPQYFNNTVNNLALSYLALKDTLNALKYFKEGAELGNPSSIKNLELLTTKMK